MDVTILSVVVAVVATVVGAAIQGSLGFGMNMVTVPFLALVLPKALPVTMIVLAVPLSIGMVRYERHALDRPGVKWILLGRIPGTIAGTAVVATVSTSILQAIAGGVVLVMVVASITVPALKVRRRSQLTAGMVSGLTGTSAGIGGPPLALLYQHHPGPTMRSTLAASFMFGTVLSLATLGVARQVHLDQLLLGAGLIPVVVAGSVAGRRFHDFLDRGWMRPAVLVFAGLAGLTTLLHAIIR